MSRYWNKTTLTVGLIILLCLPLAAPVLAAGINKSVVIEAGATADEASSVNGSITVGDGATVDGDVETVNGAIRIGSDASVGDASTVNGPLKVGERVRSGSLETVNGEIDLGGGARVAGTVSTVNGAISVEPDGVIDRDVSSVNGRIEITASEVGRDLRTVNGDVYLDRGTVLRGDLLVEKPGGWGWSGNDRRKPRIVIGPDSRVLGHLRLSREVELFVSDSAEVGGVEGVMSMADAVRFSGERP